MKWDRKAQMTGLLVKALIALVILFIISMIFFVGDDSQFGQIKHLIPSMNSEIKPDGYGTADYQFASDEENSGVVFDELLKGIIKLQEDISSNCFYFLPSPLPYDALTNDLWIRIESAGGQSTLYLEAPMVDAEDSISPENFYAQTGAPKRTAQVNAPICLIMGESADAFVEKIKSEDANRGAFLLGNYESVKQLIVKQNSFYLNGVEYDADFKTKDYQLGLVKIKDSICLMPVDSVLIALFMGDCYTSDGLLADECFTSTQITKYQEQFSTYYDSYGKCLTSEEKKDEDYKKGQEYAKSEYCKRHPDDENCKETTTN